MATGLAQVNEILRKYEEHFKLEAENFISIARVSYSNESKLEIQGDLTEERPIGCAGGRILNG